MTIQGRYEEIGAIIGRLVDKKNKAYGDAFGKTGDILRILYPHRITPEQYDDVLAIVRILDKFFRIASHRKDPMGENPWHDVTGYGTLMCRDMEEIADGAQVSFKHQDRDRSPRD
jgi:selenophosphate synthase